MKRDDEKETSTLEALCVAIRKGLDSGAGKPAEDVLARFETDLEPTLHRVKAYRGRSGLRTCDRQIRGSRGCACDRGSGRRLRRQSCPSDVAETDVYRVQSSTLSPGTRVMCSRFAVTSVAPAASVCAAIAASTSSIRVPRRSSVALMRPYA